MMNCSLSILQTIHLILVFDGRSQSQNHRESNPMLSITCSFSSYGRHVVVV